MLSIGLTGGIASGKSEVSRLLAERGVPVIDADEAAHRVERLGGAAWRPVWEAFGWSVLGADGQLARRRLGRRVFHDVESLSRLNAIVHPVVRADMQASLARWQARGAALVVLDIPLLFESGWDHEVDVVWVVFCTPEQQVRRLTARSHLTEAAALRRIAAQWPLGDKVRRADRVIDNSGSRHDLVRAVDAALASVGWLA